MITEDYVSREVAKLLKEKGFNEFGHYEYHDTLSKPHFHKKSHNFNGDEYANCGTKWYSAPTHQMAMKWLREVHGIFIAINNDDLDFNWQCYDLINRGSTLDPKILSESYAGYKTYEQAVETALKFSLENLI